MELSSAIDLIGKGIEKNGIQSWADLGAGGGLFTHALSKLLPAGSSIIAIDKKPANIKVEKGISLVVQTADFTTAVPANLDGVLMANALHYVRDQKAFLEQLSTKTKRVVIVEYDMDRSNQWVPYPISFNKLKSLYPNATKIGEESSVYNKDGMYSALISF